MFRTIVTYLTLIGFTNSCCLDAVRASSTMQELHVGVPQVAAAPTLHIRLDVNEAGQFVIDGNNLFDTDFEQVNFMSGNTVVAELSNQQGHLDFRGFSSHSFYFSHLPLLNSLKMNLGGAMTMDGLLECRDFLELISPGNVLLKHGYRVHSPQGVVLFSGGIFKVDGKSKAQALKLRSLDGLIINKGACLDSGLLVSEGVVKSLRVLGELKVAIAAASLETVVNNNSVEIEQGRLAIAKLTNNKDIKVAALSLKADQLTNNGHMEMIRGDVDIANAINAGKFQVHETFSAKGSWSNTAKGQVVLGEHFRGSFASYVDDGSTSVNGVARVVSERGRLTGDFKARNAAIQFKDDLSVSETAKFSVENSFALHSNKDMAFAGSVLLKFRPDWPAVKYSAQSLEMMRGMNPGAQISAGGNLKRSGHVASNNSSIVFSAGAKYEEAAGSSTRSGFFAGNSTFVAAEEAQLKGDTRSFNDVSLKAKLAELMGHRDIEGLFELSVGDLVQHKDDSTKAGVISGHIENGTLAGSIELGKQMVLKVANLFKTEADNLIKGGAAVVVGTKNAILSGHLKDATLQVEAEEEIKLGRTLDADVKASQLKADTILHETGSKLNAVGQNYEEAKTGIRVQNGAKVKAQDNYFKSGAWVFNSGNIESLNRYYADTGCHYNMEGGKISAKHATVNADWLNVNYAADLSAQNTEINTLINFNAFGRIRGGESLNINALLGNLPGPGAVYQSNNYTSNSLLFFVPKFAFHVRDLPTIGSEKASAEPQGFDYLGWTQTGLTLGAMVCAGTPLACVKAAQVGLGVFGFYRSASRLWNADNKGDEENYWRASRVAKRSGEMLGLALSAFQVYQGALGLYDGIVDPAQSVPQGPISYKDRAWDFGANFIGGNVTANSVYAWDNGVNLTGHVTSRSVWHHNNSWTAAITRNVSTVYGSDTGATLAYRDTTLARKNFTVGGRKYVLSDYTVTAGGNVLVEGSTNIRGANSVVKADGKMDVERGAHAAGVNVAFLSKSNMQFAGVVDASKQASIKSEASITLRTGSQVDGKEVASVSGGRSVLVYDGAKVSGEKVSCEGRYNTVVYGTLDGTKETRVHTPEGDTTLRKGAVVKGETTSVTSAYKTTVEKGATASGTNVLVQGDKSTRMDGTVDALEKALVDSKNGSTTLGEGAAVKGGQSAVVTAATDATAGKGATISGPLAVLAGKDSTYLEGVMAGEKVALGFEHSRTEATETAVLRYVAPKTSGEAQPAAAVAKSEELTAPLEVKGSTVKFAGRFESDTPGVDALINGKFLVEVMPKATADLSGTLYLRSEETRVEPENNFNVGGLDNKASRRINFNGKVDATGDIQNISDGFMTFGPKGVANGRDVTTQGEWQTTVSGTMNATGKAKVNSVKCSSVIEDGGVVSGNELAAVTAKGLVIAKEGAKISGDTAGMVGQDGTYLSGEVAGEQIVVGTKKSQTSVGKTGVIRHTGAAPEVADAEPAQAPVEKPTHEPAQEPTIATEEETPSAPVQLKGKRILFEGTLISENPKAAVLMDAEEWAKITGTAKIDIPGELQLRGNKTEVEPSASVKVGSYGQEGNGSSTFAGKLEAQTTVDILSKGQTTVTKDASIKLAGVDYKPPVENQDGPKVVDEALTISGASTSVAGNIDTKTGFEFSATAGALQLAEGLKVVAKGDGYAMASGNMVKAEKTDVAAKNLTYKADDGLRVNGVSTAENDFTAVAKGSIVEESGTKTTAGNEASYTAGAHMITHAGATDKAKRVFHHGEQGNDYAGTKIASEVSSTTAGNGTLHLRNAANVQAPHNQVHTEGQAIIDHGATVQGNSLSLKGKGIQDVPDLFTQTNRYGSFKIVDYVYVETDQHVQFNHPATSASKRFDLHTNQITVAPKIVLKTPEIFSLNATQENLTVGHGTTLGGGVALELTSEKDIIFGFEQTIHRGKKNRIVGVDYSVVNLVGGTGQAYEYIDPATGEKSIRYMGINVDAKGRVIGTGTNMGATSGDIRVSGAQGVSIGGAAQQVVTKVKTYKNGWRKKEKIYTDARFCTPTMSTDGKIAVLSEFGGFSYGAGLIRAGQGADILVNGDVTMQVLRGRQGHTTTRTNNYTDLLDSKDKSFRGKAVTMTVVNQGGDPARIWSKSGDIHAPGFVYYGENSKLSMKGHNLFLSRPILNNQSSSHAAKLSGDYSMFEHMKSLSALQAAKDVVHDLNQGDWGDALVHAAAPTVEVGLDWVSSKSKWQTLGPGSILTQDLEMEFTGGIYQKNAYGINVLNDADVIAPIWQQKGAKLKYSTESSYFGIFARASGDDATVGLRIGGSKTKGHNWETADTNVGGTLRAQIGHLNQDAATMNVGSAEGRIDNFTSRTRQDKSKTKSWGASVDYKGKVTANYGENGSRNANHTSGLNVQNPSDGFSIGKARLKGAELNGAHAESVKHKSLPEDYTNRGFSLGVSCNTKDAMQSGNVQDVKNVVVHAGVHENGHSVNASVKLGDNPKDPTKLWNSAGSVSYNNEKKGIHINDVPLVTSVNPEAWTEFKNDTVELGGKAVAVGEKIVDGVQKLMEAKEPVAAPAPVEPALPEQKREVFNSTWPEDVLDPEAAQQSTEETEHGHDVPLEVELTEKTATTMHSIAEASHGVEGAEHAAHEASVAGHAASEAAHEASAAGHAASEAAHEASAAGHAASEAAHEAGAAGHGASAAAKEFEGAFHGQYPGAFKWSLDPAAAGLEELIQPIVFEGHTFKYRVPGTNCYLENPSQMQGVLDARAKSAASPSGYVQRAYNAANKKELGVFYFDSTHTPFGNTGCMHTSNELKGINGMDGDFVAVGTKITEPHDNIFSREIHEKGHFYRAEEGAGFTTPGRVRGNPELTKQNVLNLLEEYGADARALGFENFKQMPRPVYNAGRIEAYLMYNVPFEYFENSFRASLIAKGVHLPERQIQTLLHQAEQSILTGNQSLARMFSRTDDVGKSLEYAAKSLVDEIPALFTEADGMTPGIVKKWAPKADEWLDVLDDKSVFKFGQGPMPGPVPPVTPGKWTRFCNGAAKFGHAAAPYIPAVDYGLHVWVEGVKPGTADMPQAFGRAVIPTLSDAFVYGNTFGMIARSWGNPVALSVAAFTLGSEFLPEYTQPEILNAYGKALDAREARDPLAFTRASEDAALMTGLKEAKRIGTVLRHTSEAITDLTREIFPKAEPNMCANFKFFADIVENDAKKTHNMLMKLAKPFMPDAPVYEVKSMREIQQDVQAYHRELLRQVEIKRDEKLLRELDKVMKEY